MSEYLFHYLCSVTKDHNGTRQLEVGLLFIKNHTAQLETFFDFRRPRITASGTVNTHKVQIYFNDKGQQSFA